MSTQAPGTRIRDARSRRTADRALWLGAAVWAALAITPEVGIALVDALLAVAVAVTVPAAAALHPDARPGWTPVAVAAGLPVVVATAVPQGTSSALLTLPWLLLAVGVAGHQAWVWLTRDRHEERLLWTIAAAYLVVGAGWLTAHRLALEPAGFGAPVVALTAVHFHHAGTLTLTLTLAARRWRPDDRTARAASWLVAAGPPLVAGGFLLAGALQVLGAVALTVGLFLWAWVTWRRVLPEVQRAAHVPLAVAAVSVVVPMALAVHWAVATTVGRPALSVPVMAATHGVLNAFGVTLAGVLGWRQALRYPPLPRQGGRAGRQGGQAGRRG